MYVLHQGPVEGFRVQLRDDLPDPVCRNAVAISRMIVVAQAIVVVHKLHRDNLLCKIRPARECSEKQMQPVRGLIGVGVCQLPRGYVHAVAGRIVMIQVVLFSQTSAVSAWGNSPWFWQ
ncbi:hypothetical protein PG989_007927 [Apiospora arundinis]